MIQLISGKRYIFYEKVIDNEKEKVVIFEAEFIDIIKGVYDTIRVRMYRYVDDDLIYTSRINSGMLTLPYNWIVKIEDVVDMEVDYLKQIYLEV